jgi:DNA-binding CsgD family transcriptional regulator
VEASRAGAGGITGSFDLQDLDDLEARPSRAGARSAALTERERAVIGLLAEGHRTEEIAEALCVSPHTIRSRIKQVLRKLGARNREHAVAIAISEGAIEPEL